MSTNDTAIRNDIGLLGFKCPLDKYETNKPFDYCLLQCPTPCLELPELYVCAQHRGIVPRRFSVTEILNPFQQVFLKRNFGYYVKPESRVWLNLGTGYHSVIEKGLNLMPEEERKFYIVEKDAKFEVGFDGCTLVGQPDYYDEPNKKLVDFKTMKAYSVKKLLEGDWEGTTYHWQMNFYRAFKFPEATRLVLSAIIKDWSTRVWDKDMLSPMEKISCPIYDIDAVKERAEQLTKSHLFFDTGSKNVPPPCKDEDMWIQTNPRSSNCGVPLRCRDYCEVNDLCPQASKWKEKYNGWKRPK